MKVKVQMFVSEKLAIIGNKAKSGEVVIDVDTADLNEKERFELTTLDKLDNGAFKAYTSGIPIQWGHKIAEATVDELKSILAEHELWRKKEEERLEGEIAKEDASAIKRIEEWIADPDRWLTNVSCEVDVVRIYNYKCKKTIDQYLEEVPGFKGAMAEAEALSFWVRLDKAVGRSIRAKAEETEKARREAERAEEEARQAEQVRLQDKYIAKWVASNGSRSQRERFKENMLSRAEAIDAIRNEAYTALDGFQRYRKLRVSEVCVCDQASSYEYDYCDVDFEVGLKTSATTEEFEVLKQMRAIMPGAVVELKEHVGRSTDCENVVTRVAIMVKQTVGPFDFSREYLVGDPTCA